MIETTGTIPPEGGRPEIFFRRWTPDTGSDGEPGKVNGEVNGKLPVLVVCHGYAEHSGRYRGFARYFTDRGYRVYSPDLRGHGRSGGERAFARSFAPYVEDVRIFLDQMRGETDAPVILVGHSMGGAIALIYAGTYGAGKEWLTGLIVSAPALRLSVKSGFLLRLLVNLLAATFPRMKAAPTVADSVSKDPAVVADYKDDPLVYTEQTKAAMARAFIRAEDEVVPVLSNIDLPLLVVQGADDRIIDTESSRIVSGAVASRDTTLKYYEGLYHEIFNEPEREEVFADLAGWLESRRVTGESTGA